MTISSLLQLEIEWREEERERHCCVTQTIPSANNTGQWLLPSGADVGDASSSAGDFYISRGDSVIRLHQRNNTFSTGMYCCEVPNAQSQNIRTCANISGLIVCQL